MMNDERSQAIADMRRMKAEYMNGKEMNEVTERKCRSFDTAIKAIEQTTWIPVSERLPEENETVLINYCRLNEHSVRMAIWDELHCRFYNSEYTKYVSVDFVTAWMPLPEPYKGE